MKGSLNPKIKICCIGSVEEAKLAMEYGASAVGFVGNMPSGPGVISDSLIAEITKTIPSNILTFLLTSETTISQIIEHHNRVHTNTIQIVDKLEENNYQELRDNLPRIKIVQVVHVLDESSIQEAIEISKYVDYILLDSGNPNLETKILGGTGNVHNWEISKIIREKIDVPMFLAGGLNSENVAEAIEFVQPYGVDLCSGVRTKGKLDENKLKKFFEAVNG